MKKENKKQSAFTLIEVILFTALFSIFIISMSAFINTVISVKAKNIIILDIERQGEYISSLIYESIVNSQSLNSPSSGVSTSLSLNTNYSNLNPTIYRITNDRITIKEGTASEIYLNSENINAEDLIFSENSALNTPNNITATFTLSTNSDRSGSEFNYSQDFYVSASRRY